MEKMLLLTFTEKKSGKPIVRQSVNGEIAVLMLQMREYMDVAVNDLLQPRPEAVQQILRRAFQ